VGKSRNEVKGSRKDYMGHAGRDIGGKIGRHERAIAGWAKNEGAWSCLSA